MPWSSSRMFTPNERLLWIACWVLLRVFRHTRSIGGSSDSDETALAVAPKSSSPSRLVSTVTPLAKWPMTCRKVSLSVMSRVLSEVRPVVRPITIVVSTLGLAARSCIRRGLSVSTDFRDSWSQDRDRAAAVAAVRAVFPFDGKTRCVRSTILRIVAASSPDGPVVEGSADARRGHAALAPHFEETSMTATVTRTAEQEARRRSTVVWVVGLAFVGLVFDGYDLVVYGAVLSTFLRDPTQIGTGHPRGGRGARQLRADRRAGRGTPRRHHLRRHRPAQGHAAGLRLVLRRHGASPR